MPIARAWSACLLALVAATPVLAQPLPPEVEAALARARIPREAIAVVVAEAGHATPPRLAWRADAALQPASLAKLATTFAALDLLGPAWRWTTPVYLDGPVRDGTLQGSLYIRGQGDPKLVLERLWLLLRRVKSLGVRQIAGDIVLDRSAFDVPARNAAAFDGEPLRPYNASPDALLLNYKSVVYSFTPLGQQAMVQADPPLDGVQVPASVPLLPSPRGGCGDWRSALRADFSNPAQVKFAGGYPAGCGENSWPVAFADPSSYAERAVGGLWRQLGGGLQGRVREGRVPDGLAPAFESASPPLAEVVRDINKFSNNVMAQQLFLTLGGLQQGRPATLEGGRAALQAWWKQRFPADAQPPYFDNGSGLSREERITAGQLAGLLQAAWASPVMPELLASLPVVGVDGTLRRAHAAPGLAHLKTGSLRDVAGIAGIVDGLGGRRWVLVAVVNHPQAAAARPALDALVDWAAQEP
ncbi:MULTISPECIES: D-alanyl-D-alanine carboxypeptidase/D-alanyl-D-alanine-endopeptidase [Ramlibacter]|uniref:D-alanyl-D-alanine carboxypeptidase/D-alanyl-D-alanine-endopeptidase n=1 Tax=Ramlibacter aquaticus TaxID=2780094 RepID=A0ABR9SDH2_9BURK|nr:MULTISPECIES: D-alanyl-D-alanine carboxypeptidase/D-alanyl-D-alanine-endopeptidase [Ramlibacter]MBE7939782.1 D-alanyl-D-alanine carboxypeptidase/D-alanyl-D-alanine-endopeptidase [Ramlibacter aquaticus]